MITPYSLNVDGLADLLAVRSIDGREALSKSWSFKVDVRVEGAAAEDLERIALGRQAELVFEVGEGSRSFNGLVSAVRVLGRREKDSRDYRLEIVPRLWLLERKRRTRIFQNLRIVDIVASVLGEAGIASRWQLQHTYPLREYVTQYEETDYQFVTRLLAEAGIFFHFFEGAGGASSFASALTSAATALSTSVGALAAAHGPLVPGDSIICSDDAIFYPAMGGAPEDLFAALSAVTSVFSGTDAVGTAAGAVSRVAARLSEKTAPTLHFLEIEGGTERMTDKITRFDLQNSLRSTAANFREYDPERPLMRFSSSAVSNAPFGDEGLDFLASAASTAAEVLSGTEVLGVGTDTIAKVVSTVTTGGAPPFLEVYDHHASMLFPKWSQPSDEAPRLLRQERRRASVARGSSGCPDLSPGYRFTLQGHPASALDQTYAVVSVRHRGNVHADAAGNHRVYACEFECVPSSVTFVPKKPKRKSVQVCLTAVVTGPHGSEIHVDERGQIKVQFHWHREGAGDDTSSCWIRTMQPWAGAGWGSQFIPRVGMEVVVTFEGGDPDKPLVLGSVVNATHPPPFVLPQNKTRSGIRTQSTPGQSGFNELSFEDSQGSEQIFLQAQKNLDEVVGHDHTLRVENDERIRILGSRVDTIEKNLEQLVKGNVSEEIAGNRSLAIAGDSDERVSGMSTSRVEGKLLHSSRGDVIVETESDVTLRTLGSITTVVGKTDKPRSWVTHAEGAATLAGLKRLELTSDTEVVLSVGKSTIRIAKDRVEISADAVVVTGAGAAVTASKEGLAMSSKGDGQLTVEKKFTVKSEAASMSLSKEIKLDGSKILLNSPDQAEEAPPGEPEPPTTIVLSDADGTPLAEQRWLITLDDGTQQSGRTGSDGKTELALTQGGEIVFPELTMRGDVPKGAPQPYVIRQGDFYEKLAFKYAFDAEKVWNDGKNAELKAKRKNPNQLAPGDILHFAPSSKKPLPLSKGTTNEYTAEVPRTKVTLFFKDELMPFDGEAYVIEGLPQPVDGKVGGDGAVTIEAPIHVREVRIVFKKRNFVFPVKLGDMDPINETSGVRTRLEHLGYLRPSAEPLSEEEADERLVTATQEFQRAHKLEPTGEIDDATRAKLEEAHGG